MSSTNKSENKHIKKDESIISSFSIWKLLPRLRNRHFAMIDILILTVIPSIALALRVSVPWEPYYTVPLIFFTIISLCIKFPIFFRFKLYARYWRYASVDEMIAIGISVFAATPLLAFTQYLLQGLGLLGDFGLPRSLPFIDGLLTMFFVGGTRFSVKMGEYLEARTKKGSVFRKRILIAGAGASGEVVLREIYSSSKLTLDPVGFVDDSNEKVGTVIRGVKVLGSLNDIPELVSRYGIQEVIIAMPTAPGSVIRQTVKLCETAGVISKSVPGIYEMLNGQASINRIREVNIEDLLRREPVEINIEQVEKMIAGKKVLVTGAGGSIGSELCFQIARCKPSLLIMVGHGENSLFLLANQLIMLRKVGINLNFNIVLADIRDRHRLESIFKQYSPQIIFHAAAHKHVPLTEDNVEDAVTTNVLGTRNLTELSIASGVERFVLISTDKAVNPVNVLGMTKRIAEMIVRNAAMISGTPFVSVRFGNVLGSRGSVVPLFTSQIASGGPVTVTHPEMCRFFMTIPEAVQLVLQAATLGKGKEVFVLDMGEPVKIIDLARDMIALSGYEPDKDIEIIYTGLRQGEKLYEELFMEDEYPERTQHDKIFVAVNGSASSPAWFDPEVNQLINLAERGNVEGTRQKLIDIVSKGNQELALISKQASETGKK
jgi:FlaA1/EpsC-like NDP-sugar epimerase